MNPPSRPILQTKWSVTVPCKQLKGYNCETMHDTVLTLVLQVGGNGRLLREDSAQNSLSPEDTDFFIPETMSSTKLKETGKHTLTRNIYKVMKWATKIPKHWQVQEQIPQGDMETLGKNSETEAVWLFGFLLVWKLVLREIASKATGGEEFLWGAVG